MSFARTVAAAISIGISLCTPATFIPAQVKPFGTARSGTSHTPNSWNLWAPVLHCTISRQAYAIHKSATNTSAWS